MLKKGILFTGLVGLVVTLIVLLSIVTFNLRSETASASMMDVVVVTPKSADTHVGASWTDYVLHFPLFLMEWSAEPIQQAPYGGTAWVIPGKIEAENYDIGGEGIAFHDVDVVNHGGSYRPQEGVDIAQNPIAIGWIEPDEWTEYTVDIAQSGGYKIEIRYQLDALPQTVLHIEIDGNTVSGPITLHNTETSGWTIHDVAGVNLPAGQHVLRLRYTGDLMLDWVKYDLDPSEPTVTSTPSVTLIPPTATATATGTPIPPTATATVTSTPIPPTATATATPHAYSTNSDGDGHRHASSTNSDGNGNQHAYSTHSDGDGHRHASSTNSDCNGNQHVNSTDGDGDGHRHASSANGDSNGDEHAYPAHGNGDHHGHAHSTHSNGNDHKHTHSTYGNGYCNRHTNYSADSNGNQHAYSTNGDSNGNANTSSVNTYADSDTRRHC